MKKLICLLLVLWIAPAVAQPSYEAMLSLRPAGENSCVAVEISTPTGAPITGLKWMNNDSQQVFPRLVLLEGEPGTPPDLTSPALVLVELSGASLDWGQVDFGGPVVSSTGTAYAVFYFPVTGQIEALGKGGGPGIGIRQTTSGSPFYLTGDGTHWTQFSSDYELRVETIGVLLKGSGAVRTLSELAGTVLDSKTGKAPTPTHTALYAPSPNPFNPRVTLSYTLARPSAVSLTVYDVMGRRVKTLVSRQETAGKYEVIWEGQDNAGRSVASGVYFARFVADGVEQSFRMALVR